jgi:3-methyladenine DNA glycosylase AlkD
MFCTEQNTLGVFTFSKPMEGPAVAVAAAVATAECKPVAELMQRYSRDLLAGIKKARPSSADLQGVLKRLDAALDVLGRRMESADAAAATSASAGTASASASAADTVHDYCATFDAMAVMCKDVVAMGVPSDAFGSGFEEDTNYSDSDTVLLRDVCPRYLDAGVACVVVTKAAIKCLVTMVTRVVKVACARPETAPRTLRTASTMLSVLVSCRSCVPWTAACMARITATLMDAMSALLQWAEKQAVVSTTTTAAGTAGSASLITFWYPTACAMAMRLFGFLLTDVSISAGNVAMRAVIHDVLASHLDALIGGTRMWETVDWGLGALCHGTFVSTQCLLTAAAAVEAGVRGVAWLGRVMFAVGPRVVKSLLDSLQCMEVRPDARSKFGEVLRTALHNLATTVQIIDALDPSHAASRLCALPLDGVARFLTVILHDPSLLAASTPHSVGTARALAILAWLFTHHNRPSRVLTITRARPAALVAMLRRLGREGDGFHGGGGFADVCTPRDIVCGVAALPSCAASVSSILPVLGKLPAVIAACGKNHASSLHGARHDALEAIRALGGEMIDTTGPCSTVPGCRFLRPTRKPASPGFCCDVDFDAE